MHGSSVSPDGREPEQQTKSPDHEWEQLTTESFSGWPESREKDIRENKSGFIEMRTTTTSFTGKLYGEQV